MLLNKLTFVLLMSCAFICVNTQQADADKAKTSTSTSTTTTTTTTTTPASTTTTSTTTTTTPAPTTSTVGPNTTTPEPYTTTPAPAPLPEPSVVTWNSSCIMIKMATQLNFTYETKDNSNATTLYNIPADAKVDDSDCAINNQSQNIQIVWGEPTAKHGMVLQFDKINNTAKMTMMYIVLHLTQDRFPNAKENQTIQLLHRGFNFSAPLQMSYHCTRPQTLNFTETVDDKTIVGYATVHDVQAEAFRAATAKGFSEARDCDSSESSDIVPIAVGIALAALIVIVLIAYICARRRSAARGYMSF